MGFFYRLRFASLASSLLTLFFVFVPPASADQSEQRVDIIYSEKISEEILVEDKTETETSRYSLATGGEIEQDIRCDNDGDPMHPWTIGQRIPSFIPNIEKISVRSSSRSTNIQYQLRAYVATVAIATTTSASVICTSGLSAAKDTTAYAYLDMTFTPACELQPNTDYWIYLDAVNCETSPAAYNAPRIAVKYDAWGGRRYYDFYRTTTIVNDYDLHAIISYASTTYEAITIEKTEHQSPLIVLVVVVCFGLILFGVVLGTRTMLRIFGLI